MTRRSTRTTIVLSILSLTTVPVRMRFGIPLSLTLAGGARGRRVLIQNRPDARALAAPLTDAGRTLDLSARPLEPQVERFLLARHQLALEVVARFRAEFTCL